MHVSWHACCATGLRLAGASREKILRYARPSLMSQPTPRATATNRTASGLDSTVSFGIRTVNPGFYLPGIEVYSVLSSPRPCASYPSRTCVLSYVQPSCGKTLAYLRFSIRQRERRREGRARKNRPPPSLRVRSSPSLVCRCP